MYAVNSIASPALEKLSKIIEMFVQPATAGRAAPEFPRQCSVHTTLTSHLTHAPADAPNPLSSLFASLAGA
jgi:hypothetical protein